MRFREEEEQRGIRRAAISGKDRRTGETRYVDYSRTGDEVREIERDVTHWLREQHPEIKSSGDAAMETNSIYRTITFPNGSVLKIRFSDHTKGYTEEKLDNYGGNGISWCPIYSYRDGNPHSVKGVEAYIDISCNRMGAEELMQFIDKMAEYDRDGFPKGLLELADAGEKEMLQKTGTRVPVFYVEDPRILQSFGMDIAPVEGIKEKRLRSVNYHFNKELSRFDNFVRYYDNEDIANRMFAGKPAKEHIFQLGMPSDELLSAGVQDLPLELSASTLIEKSSEGYKKNHPFEIESIKDLPVALAHPIAVFKSLRDGERTKVILVELKEGDNNFIVAITPRKNKNMVVVNDTKSLYPKDSKLGIISWINKKLLKGVDKNKFSDYFSTQWPNDTERQEIKPEIREQLISATKIVEDFDSTKSFGENIGKGNGGNLRFREEDEGTRPSGPLRPGEGIFDRAEAVSRDYMAELERVRKSREEAKAERPKEEREYIQAQEVKRRVDAVLEKLKNITAEHKQDEELTRRAVKALNGEMLALVNDNTPTDDPNYIEMVLLSNLVADYCDENYAMTPPTLVEMIKLRMYEMGFTQVALSKLLGINTSRISEYLNGKKMPTLSHARTISQKLDISPSIVLGV